jgi:hypothetical protein
MSEFLFYLYLCKNQLMFPKLLEVKPLPDFTLLLKYDDGVKGNISLKKLSATDVFSAWKNKVNFSKVSIPRDNVIAWNDEMEIDADSLYLELRGITFEQLKQESNHHASIK